MGNVRRQLLLRRPSFPDKSPEPKRVFQEFQIHSVVVRAHGENLCDDDAEVVAPLSWREDHRAPRRARGMLPCVKPQVQPPIAECVEFRSAQCYGIGGRVYTGTR